MNRRPSDAGPSGSDNRLGDLGRRLEQLRGQRVEPTRTDRRGTQLGFAFRLATELVAGFVVGGGIGWLLDDVFGTLPLFLLIFFALGAAAGIANVVRTAKAMNEAADEPGSHDGERRDE